jgi:TatD DNase family protein
VVKEILKRDFMISLPGVITFVNLDDSIKQIPLEKLMVETDSPFAAPIPYRGKTNLPIYVEEVVRKIAEVKELDFEEVKKQMIKNALGF